MTVLKYLDMHAAGKPGETYLVDRREGENTGYSFSEVHHTVEATAKSLASLFPGKTTNVSILAKNCAH